MATAVPNPFDTQQPVIPAQADTALATPTDWSVTPDQTVESRTAGIIEKNSPLMQLAETQAKQAMNDRGLVNSSMAVGAGQTAVMDQATKIAGQDAATAASAANYNASARNQSALANAAATNQTNQFNAGAKNQLGLIDKSTQADLAKMTTAQGFDLAKMDAATQNTLATMNAEQQNNLVKMATAQGYDVAKMSAQQVNDLAKMAQGFTNDQMTMLAKFDFDKQLVEIQRASNESIAGLEAQYKNLTQASTSATSIFNSTQARIASIMENTTLDAAAKQVAIDTYTANMQQALSMIGAISGDVDLVAYFDEILA